MKEGILFYVVINVSIGVGIAADAMLATISRARTLASRVDAMKWASAIGMTHWLFPMAGFLGGWYIAGHGAARAMVYGLGGAVLIGYVLQVLRERSRLEPEEVEGQPARTSRAAFWLAVWGVSIDALVTGPGKAAATAHWTTTQVFLSFPFVGAVVFGLVLASTVPAMILHQRIVASAQSGSWRGVAIFFNAATWVEVVVFTWFSTLSLVEACGALHLITPSYLLVTEIALVAGLMFVTLMGSRVWRVQAAAARKLVAS